MRTTRPILVTGFEGFTTRDGLRIDPNPTAEMALQLATGEPGLEAAVLPCSFRRTRPALESLFERHRPRAWLGLGIAATRERIDLEAVGLNIEYAARTDNDGDSPNGRPIIEGDPLARRTGLDVVACAKRLAGAGLPVGVSWSAGTFLCNQALFVGCHHADSSGIPGVAAFVHIPLHGIEADVVMSALRGILSVLG